MHSPSPSDETKKNKDGSQKPSSSTKVNPVSQSPNVTSSASPPSQSGATEKKKEKKKKEEDKSSSENVISETCDGSVKKCSVSKKVVACIKSVDNGNSQSHCYSTSVLAVNIYYSSNCLGK